MVVSNVKYYGRDSVADLLKGFEALIECINTGDDYQQFSELLTVAHTTLLACNKSGEFDWALAYADKRIAELNQKLAS